MLILHFGAYKWIIHAQKHAQICIILHYVTTGKKYELFNLLITRQPLWRPSWILAVSHGWILGDFWYVVWGDIGDYFWKIIGIISRNGSDRTGHLKCTKYVWQLYFSKRISLKK